MTYIRTRYGDLLRPANHYNTSCLLLAPDCLTKRNYCHFAKIVASPDVTSTRGSSPHTGGEGVCGVHGGGGVVEWVQGSRERECMYGGSKRGNHRGMWIVLLCSFISLWKLAIYIPCEPSELKEKVRCAVCFNVVLFEMSCHSECARIGRLSDGCGLFSVRSLGAAPFSPVQYPYLGKSCKREGSIGGNWHLKGLCLSSGSYYNDGWLVYFCSSLFERELKRSDGWVGLNVPEIALPQVALIFCLSVFPFG